LSKITFDTFDIRFFANALKLSNKSRWCIARLWFTCLITVALLETDNDRYKYKVRGSVVATITGKWISLASI